jgi:hypothetical protein
MYVSFCVRHQPIAEAFAKRNLALELQRERRRVYRAAAELAAIRIRLLVLEIKCQLHLLQRAIAARENMRREFLTTSEDNKYLISVPAPTPRPASNHSHEIAREVGKAELPHPTATPKTEGRRGGRSVHGDHRAVTGEFLKYKRL